MARGRKGSLVKSKINMLVYGEQFTGKSTMAMDLCRLKRDDGKPFRVLYLDTENGSIDEYIEKLEDDGIDLENLYIVYTQSLQEVREYISKIKNNEDFYELDDNGNETEEIVKDAEGKPFRADAVVVDSTTILELTTKQGLLQFSKKRNAVKAAKAGLVGDERLVKVDGSGLEYKDYQTVKFRGQDLVLDLAATGINWVITAREADETKNIENADGTTSSVSTGRKIPEGFKSIGHNAKTVVRMYVDKKSNEICAHVIKDRTNCHNDDIALVEGRPVILRHPTLLDWQAILDKSKNRKNYAIRNGLSDSVEIEQEKYEKDLNAFVDEEIIDNSDTPAKTDGTEKVRTEILEKMRGFAPTQKSNAKKALTESGLPSTPTAVKTETDISVLQKILETISA